MNEAIVNRKEIESIWEKDNLCFVKMKSGKVWLCNQFKDITKRERKPFDMRYSISVKDYIIESDSDMVRLPLSQKNKD